MVMTILAPLFSQPAKARPQVADTSATAMAIFATVSFERDTGFIEPI